MAFSVGKMATFLGLKDDPELNEVAVAQEPVRSGAVSVREPRGAAVRNVASRPVAVAVQPELSPMDRIITLHPRTYSEARTIGEQYREGNPVIMNLSDMEETERKRLVDFASGLVFGLHGSIERVTSKVFLLSPENVSVSNDAKTAAAEASFYNQS
jgi:cell division inhibitor SepF|uniref:cell division protein SepF n=1 Tax=Candidatus Planktophila sp. TaxID=2175601 RepID=UPI00404A6764